MFAGFTTDHFDAYAGHKWRSNAFNLERRAVRDALQALGRDLLPELAATGATLACEVSPEHPTLGNRKQVDAQELYFGRPVEARTELDRIMDRSRGMASLLEDPSPQRSHLVLAVSIAHDHIYVGLKLHHDAAIDRRNLAARVTDAWQAQTLLSLVAALPAPLAVSVDDVTGPAAPAATADASPPRSGSAVTADDLTALVGQLGADPPAGASRWLTIGRRIERDDAVALAADIRAQIAEALLALVPIYRFVAWARDNDHIDLRQTLGEHRVATRQRGLAVGDEVQIAAGVFAGRRGVVQEIDQKGMVKVLIGNVPLKMRAGDLQKR